MLIPFPYATDNHQYFNALDLLNKDMAYLIEESDLDKEKLENVVINNLNNDERLKAMREKIRSSWSSRAVSSIVDDIMSNLKNN